MRWSRVGLAVALATVQAPALGQDDAARNAARGLAVEGVRLLRQGRCAAAQLKLHRAYRLYPTPTVALFEGEALERLGRLVEAAERYHAAQLAELPPGAHSALRRAVGRATDRLKWLEPRIPALVVQLEGAAAAAPGIEVTLDGVALPRAMLGLRRPVNPGEHEVVVALDGQASQRERVMLEPGQTATVVLQVAELDSDVPEPRAPTRGLPAGSDPRDAAARDSGGDSSAHRTLGWVSLGIGAVGLGVGVLAGIVMTGLGSTLERSCPDGRCPPKYEDEVTAWATWRTVSFVGIGVGVVGLATGATLQVTLPAGDSAGQARTGVPHTPAQIVVRGAF